uniref:Uncharacterized protein n=1 Tax=Nelumbo nucifera TaxID=4432 RepID=A0A822XDL7_NELNU|nr:TPA_asm: hypothetical protein HUJ06_019740 [Nelumbo nucifera]
MPPIAITQNCLILSDKSTINIDFEPVLPRIGHFW